MDFIIYGVSEGKDVWYRWNNGTLTASDRQRLNQLENLAQMYSSLLDLGTPAYERPRYECWKAFSHDPLVFRLAVIEHGLDWLDRIKGDAPALPSLQPKWEVTPEEKAVDFTIYGKRAGYDVWYRWNHGDVTTNDLKGIEHVVWMALTEQVLDMGIFVYDYQDYFHAPDTFYILTSHMLDEFDRLEGEKPDSPSLLSDPRFII
jgi:hypothetical protein